MKTWLLLIAFSAACLKAEEAKFYRGVSTDNNWPHRYVIEVRENQMTVQVEQQIDVQDENSEWFSWGRDVKIGKVEKNKITFGCPWGVLGKLLSVDCSLEFEEIKREGFNGVITIDSFEKSIKRDLKFTPISKKELTPAIDELVEKAEQGGVE